MNSYSDAPTGAAASRGAEQPAQALVAGLYVVVLALNEAHRLPQCLHSAAFAEKVIVIDSGSTDDTVAVARACGAQVHVHADWQGFAAQRNRALAYCHDARYVFFLDADELIALELRAEITAIVQSGVKAAWVAHWNYIAFGTPLTRMNSTRGVERFFHVDALKGFEGAVHEHAVLSEHTDARQLKHRLLHHSYESVHGGLKKLSQYAMLGAAKHRERGERGGVLRGLASALAVFVRLYFFKRGFLHGGPGFLFCYFLAQERFFRYAALHYDRDNLTETIRR